MVIPVVRWESPSTTQTWTAALYKLKSLCNSTTGSSLKARRTSTFKPLVLVTPSPPPITMCLLDSVPLSTSWDLLLQATTDLLCTTPTTTSVTETQPYTVTDRE